MYYDLHIHSCLSPCGDKDMTPFNLVNMAAINGLQVIALTDHNTSRNCPAAVAAGRDAGILVVPGMELTTSEEVHVVCLFPTVEAALDFSDEVYKKLPPIDNVPDIFGEQLVVDAEDNVTEYVDKLLINATSISVMDVVQVVSKYAGFCYPAHIDRSSYSILANIGAIPPECNFTAAEISKDGDDLALIESNPILRSMRRMHSSDAHYLEDIAEPIHRLKISAESAAEVIDFLRTMGE